ncbi:DUF1593 domain-containing protein [Reichenbachiella ulvae]|uniref:DUF1593 domain-containing protein n=1 Tax=Reichenbachiella ulvae TaxID=2980104 RepID=A0ABT3D1I6_9BACT|nr:DUF1593 domain-containing protein [Reichenbachiella ulvae]MCV9389308.1 DUF1593 domain-containing protein [Reichenbachiella ulvae]
MRLASFTLAFLFAVQIVLAQKPSVWIYTDTTDPSLPGNNHMGTINDPDDVSAMAGYLLMANMFDTKGIIVASTHREEHAHTPDQGEWANRYYGDAYRKDVNGLNENIGGYPTNIQFTESSIKVTAERFDLKGDYQSLDKYPTVRMLLDSMLTTDQVIHVLCWGSLTEPAILVKHLIQTKQVHLFNQLKFIAHWTNSSLHQGTPEHPEHVANCREDATACAFLKEMALNGHIEYYECGAIGQHGIVSGGPKGMEYFEQFKSSSLGRMFVEGKYVHNGVDHSDAATYWVLLGDWGVSLSDIKSNGANFPDMEKANQERFAFWSQRIHDELLRRVKLCY